MTFNEGIRGIGLSSFSFCPKLTDVVLPASLIDAGLESFQGVLNVTVKDGCRVFNLPSAVMMLPGFNSQEDAMNKESLIVDVNIEGKGHVYLPKYTSSDKITYTNDFFKDFCDSAREFTDICGHVFHLLKRLAKASPHKPTLFFAIKVKLKSDAKSFRHMFSTHD